MTQKVFKHAIHITLMTESVTIQDVYKQLLEIKQNMVSKDEIANLIETVEVLHNPKTLDQVRSSERDILSGKTKTIRTMKDLMDDL